MASKRSWKKADICAYLDFFRKHHIGNPKAGSWTFRQMRNNKAICNTKVKVINNRGSTIPANGTSKSRFKFPRSVTQVDSNITSKCLQVSVKHQFKSNTTIIVEAKDITGFNSKLHAADASTIVSSQWQDNASSNGAITFVNQLVRLIAIFLNDHSFADRVPQVVSRRGHCCFVT